MAKKAAKKPAKKSVRKKTATKKSTRKKAKTGKVISSGKAGKKPAKKSASKAGNKTVKTDSSVKAYLDSVGEDCRADCETLVEIMSAATGAPPAMWGVSIVGFGDSHYKYDSGREGDWFLVGFSSRKASLSLSLCSDWPERAALLEKLGPHSTGKSCVYVESLDKVHIPTLKKLVKGSVARSKKRGLC